jgi:hypothetical protein
MCSEAAASYSGHLHTDRQTPARETTGNRDCGQAESAGLLLQGFLDRIYVHFPRALVGNFLWQPATPPGGRDELPASFPLLSEPAP